MGFETIIVDNWNYYHLQLFFILQVSTVLIRLKSSKTIFLINFFVYKHFENEEYKEKYSIELLKFKVVKKKKKVYLQP